MKIGYFIAKSFYSSPLNIFKKNLVTVQPCRYFDLYDTTDCYALCALAILKTFEIRPNRATFSCFCGSQGHGFSCKHETHDLGTLVHRILINWHIHLSDCPYVALSSVVDARIDSFLCLAYEQSSSVYVPEINYSVY